MAVKYYAVAVGRNREYTQNGTSVRRWCTGSPERFTRVLRRWKKRRRFWKAHRRVGRNSCKRSGAAEGNARSSTAEIRNSRRRQGRDERCGICRRDRGSAGELRVRGWLFSRRYRRVRLWRFLIHAGGKKCCRVREGAGDGVDAQCGRRGFREHGSHRKGA